MRNTTPDLLPTINEAVTAVLNAHGATRACPRLSWSVSSPVALDGFEGRISHIVDAAVHRWADEFELDLDEDPVPGTVRYCGRIEHVAVAVWAIVDAAAFDRAIRGALNTQEPTTTGPSTENLGCEVCGKPVDDLSDLASATEVPVCWSCADDPELARATSASPDHHLRAQA